MIYDYTDQLFSFMYLEGASIVLRPPMGQHEVWKLSFQPVVVAYIRMFHFTFYISTLLPNKRKKCFSDLVLRSAVGMTHDLRSDL